jgi:5-methylcytosine-specific restriction endonuclease McrBC GTP-binding regulatory subunit McrB
MQVDDRILPVSLKDWQVAPVLYKILSVNRSAGTLTLQIDVMYNYPVCLKQIMYLSSYDRPATKSYELLITLKTFKEIITAMGGKRMEEHVLLDYIDRYITAKGYYFSKETLYNYHICLKTRPFVILAGLSGTGKSKLSQLYAEALGHGTHYLRLPVSPSWGDDRALLGYFDTLTKEYVTGPATEFLLEANADKDNLYFFCLDEMNLAHVEYYFSQFLSAMEEEQPDRREIILMSKKEQSMISRNEAEGYEPVPQRLKIPTNLFFTGTINVDETTHPISDKVIDRANTLEFFTVELDKIPQPSTLPDSVKLSTITWQSYQRHEPDQAFRPQIIEISKILNKADLGLGYRVLRDIELYMANSQGVLDSVVAFDLQVKQRILPRVRGTEVISSTIESLLTFLKQNKLERSEQRLNEMKSRLKRDGYTSFWR